MSASAQSVLDTPLHSRLDALQRYLRGNPGVVDVAALQLLAFAFTAQASVGAQLLHTLLSSQPSLVNCVLQESLETPLHVAARGVPGEEGLACSVILLRHGANVLARNKGGQTCLHVAAAAGNAVFIALIRTKCAHLTQQLLATADSSGRTTLHVAVESSYHICVELLVSMGSDLSQQDLLGRTVLHAAVDTSLARRERGAATCLRLILESMYDEARLSRALACRLERGGRAASSAHLQAAPTTGPASEPKAAMLLSEAVDLLLCVARDGCTPSRLAWSAALRSPSERTWHAWLQVRTAAAMAILLHRASSISSLARVDSARNASKDAISPLPCSSAAKRLSHMAAAALQLPREAAIAAAGVVYLHLNERGAEYAWPVLALWAWNWERYAVSPLLLPGGVSGGGTSIAPGVAVRAWLQGLRVMLLLCIWLGSLAYLWTRCVDPGRVEAVVPMRSVLDLPAAAGAALPGPPSRLGPAAAGPAGAALQGPAAAGSLYRAPQRRRAAAGSSSQEGTAAVASATGPAADLESGGDAGQRGPAAPGSNDGSAATTSQSIAASKVSTSNGVFTLCTRVAAALDLAAFKVAGGGSAPVEAADEPAALCRRAYAQSLEHGVDACMLQCGLCVTCEIARPARSRHCPRCGACVRRYDHCCPWTGGCVGAGNHAPFLVFLAAATAACAAWLALVALFVQAVPAADDAASGGGGSGGVGLWAHVRAAPVWAVLALQPAWMGAFAALLLWQQARCIARGLTANEAANFGRYAYLRDAASGAFRNPFSRGGARANCAAFWRVAGPAACRAAAAACRRGTAAGLMLAARGVRGCRGCLLPSPPAVRAGMQ